MDLVILSGGVGGARMARGFESMSDVSVTVVVNVGDDDEVHGLHVAPDIDTVVYTLAGVEGPHGWGRSEETWNVISELERFPDADVSFRLGDRDLALNIYRTGQLRRGVALSEITNRIAKAFGVRAAILPATDDRLRTEILTEEAGWLDFQTYFVRRGHRDTVLSVKYGGLDRARPAPGVLEAIETCDAVLIAPSNPILSIWPILGVSGIRQAVSVKPTIAISPLIGGRAVKGPAVESMAAFDLDPSIDGLIQAYDGLIDALMVDTADAQAPSIGRVEILGADIMIGDPPASRRLAERIIEWVD